MIKAYYYLTKPGIIYGNALPALGGFFLAARGHVDFVLLFAMIFGLSFIIGSACIFNNCLDRDIDAKMKRTEKRALVTKTIPLKNALIFAVILLILGSLLLGLYTNILTLILSYIGFVSYVFVYTFTKRKTVHGTLLGSISGAVPPVVGYCAVTNQFDLGALLLFLILVIWQMPHFYAIAMYRKDEYKAAGIPVLPLVKGMNDAKQQIILYVLAFLVSASLLTVFGYTGSVYLFVMLVISVIWLWKGLKGLRAKDDATWARSMFLFSLIVIMVFSLMMAVGSVLP